VIFFVSFLEKINTKLILRRVYLSHNLFVHKRFEFDAILFTFFLHYFCLLVVNDILRGPVVATTKGNVLRRKQILFVIVNYLAPPDVSFGFAISSKNISRAFGSSSSNCHEKTNQKKIILKRNIERRKKS
jgi:hypothetical protein